MEIAPVMLNVGIALAACRGDPDLARAMVAQYRASLPEERAALAQARAATPPDWEAIGQRSHRLQSGSAYLGVEQIAAAARELEERILARSATDARAAAWRALDDAVQDFLNHSDSEWGLATDGRTQAVVSEVGNR